MAKKKHTPGPWKVTLNGINSPDGHLVFFDKSGGPHETDARLIEAAPELLAALERNVSRMCYAITFTKKESKAEWELSQAIDEARAAIAKATGAHQHA